MAPSWTIRGEIVSFGEVLVLGGESVTVGSPMVAGASVAAEVIEIVRDIRALRKGVTLGKIQIRDLVREGRRH